ncbi:MAG: dipeptide epimerase [Hyphomicrobiaceae bacterium]|nr:dipeptide epimerase [Hyphomicrobiaceae bacterium]
MTLQLTATVERWPIAGAFTISRGSKTEAVVVVATITDGTCAGRGECVPYPRYGESPDSVMALIDAAAPHFAAGTVTPQTLLTLMPAGAARNAVDCALWDYIAKRDGKRVATLVGVKPVRPLVTAYTLSLGQPDAMRAAAEKAAHRPLLKVKLGGADDLDPARIAAVRAGAPAADLIVDANEGWIAGIFDRNMAACADAGVKLVEQPVPEGNDAFLRRGTCPVPICADESCHTGKDLPVLATRYDAINIKLDKTGGLTEALAMARAARDHGLDIMAGCMLATSLAMAPALLIAQSARFVDLDGPLLLARDREPGLVYDGSTVFPPAPEVWG